MSNYKAGDKVVLLTRAIGNGYGDFWEVVSTDDCMVEIKQIGKSNEWVHFAEITPANESSNGQTIKSPCFDTEQEWFEHSIKSSSIYINLVYIHGERLFIMENGQYKITAIQLAWEIYQGQQKRIDELLNDAQLYLSERGALVTKTRVMRKHWQKMRGLQKRIDAASCVADKFRDKRYPFNVFCKEMDEALRGDS
ncbi:MAG: hypothetical protein ACK4KY_01950 [Acinetobacter junii]